MVPVTDGAEGYSPIDLPADLDIFQSGESLDLSLIQGDSILSDDILANNLDSDGPLVGNKMWGEWATEFPDDQNASEHLFSFNSTFNSIGFNCGIPITEENFLQQQQDVLLVPTPQQLEQIKHEHSYSGCSNSPSSSVSSESKSDSDYSAGEEEEEEEESNYSSDSEVDVVNDPPTKPFSFLISQNQNRSIQPTSAKYDIKVSRRRHPSATSSTKNGSKAQSPKNRTKHNQMERRRREQMRDNFAKVRSCVRGLPAKCSKVVTINRALDYIRNLNEEYRLAQLKVNKWKKRYDTVKKRLNLLQTKNA